MKKPECNCTICEDYVIHDPEKIQRILDECGRIILQSYLRGEKK